jgi:phosphoribosylaminoimidazolecarboxamide formyltransferase/IMP cyclohydrolase
VGIWFLEDMKKNDGKVSLALRKDLAAETFALVSEYDSMIAKYLADHDA